MIGVDDRGITLGSGPSDYKRSILFYDKLLLLHSDQALYQWTQGSHSDAATHAFADELEYLLETPYFLAANSIAGIPSTGSSDGGTSEALREVRNKIDSWLPSRGGSEVSPDRLLGALSLQSSLMTRLVAEDLTAFGTPAISAYNVPACARFEAPHLAASEVVELVIKKVRVPDARTSWEDILALKADAQLQERARKLRLWAMKTAKSESSLAMAEEHASDLLSDYERYMSAHKIKFSSIGLSAVITGTAGLVEDLVKLRIENIAKRVFSISEKKADLTLSELKAPGRDLSLVTYLNERLP